MGDQVARPVPFKVIESLCSFDHDLEKDLEILADRAIQRFKEEFPEFNDAIFYKDIVELHSEDI